MCYSRITVQHHEVSLKSVKSNSDDMYSHALIKWIVKGSEVKLVMPILPGTGLDCNIVSYED